MKYPAEIYAKAFLGALQSSGREEERSVIKNFSSLLKKNGDLQNHEKISLEIEKLMSKKDGGIFVSIEVAKKAGAAAKKLAGLFSEKDVVKINILPELLAGARILINGEREFDFSFKRRLKDLFAK